MHGTVATECTVIKWKILADHWTIKLGRQNGRLLHWPKCSCVSTKKQTLEAFVAVSFLYAKFDCLVAHQKCSLVATAYDCETAL